MLPSDRRDESYTSVVSPQRFPSARRTRLGACRRRAQQIPHSMDQKHRQTDGQTPDRCFTHIAKTAALHPPSRCTADVFISSNNRVCPQTEGANVRGSCRPPIEPSPCIGDSSSLSACRHLYMTWRITNTKQHGTKRQTNGQTPDCLPYTAFAAHC